MPACGPDSSGADAVLSRRRLHSVGTMETVVVRCGVGSWPEPESDPSLSAHQAVNCRQSSHPARLRNDLYCVGWGFKLLNQIQSVPSRLLPHVHGTTCLQMSRLPSRFSHFASD